MKDIAIKAKQASRNLMKIDKATRNKAFDSIINNLNNRKNEVIEANKLDLEDAKKSNLSSAMVDRLVIDESRFQSIVNGIISVKEQDEVVGKMNELFKREDGLMVSKQSVPLGVILMIFESRPNVVIDSAVLALKSSNAIILKGGKEAKHTNKILGSILSDSIKEYAPEDTIQVLDSTDRDIVNDLLSYKDEIDVVIPRGGKGLINHVYDNAKMPVIAHFQGLCHMYIDKEADLSKSIELVINAKTQRPGVCNAIETLLVHEEVLQKLGADLFTRLSELNTELRVDEKIEKTFPNNTFAKASSEDWETEYLSNILSIKTVSSIDDAISHIATYGSNHTECIISEDKEAQSRFLNEVDASCIMINSSTRFNDGGELGLGAEIGISTSKLHAYGPMGAEQMTSSRYVVVGDGHVRG